jgi:hypothetical protein
MNGMNIKNIILEELNNTIKKNVNSNESIEAYHGSPYKFDKFSNDKIDSGIGSQAFGYGIYFTDLKSVAKGYAESLENMAEVKIDGIVPSNFIKKYISSIIELHGNKKDLILHILKVNAKKLLLDKKISQDEYNFINNAKKITAKRSRNIYQVELHKGKSPNEYDYLDWTRNITDEQIQKIQNQIKKRGYSGRVTIENGKVYKDVGGKSEITKGRDIYQAFAGDKNFNDKEASLFLLDAGIDGIKYSSNGGYEYVVFDPNSITIKDRINF